VAAGVQHGGGQGREAARLASVPIEIVESAGTDAAAARQDSIAAFADRALAVPEAGIFALFGLGLAGIIASRARRGGR